MCRCEEIVSYINKAPVTTSQHLKKLKDAGIISVFKADGNQIYRLRSRMTTYKIVSKYLKKYGRIKKKKS